MSDNWTDETRSLAERMQRMPSGQDFLGQLEVDGLMAIASELAALRKTLSPTEITMVAETRPFAEYIQYLEDRARAAGIPLDLLPEEHETSGFALHRRMSEKERTAADLMAILDDRANIKQVGWYCAGGHMTTDHDRGQAEPALR